jgi:hypothetical protein
VYFAYFAFFLFFCPRGKILENHGPCGRARAKTAPGAMGVYRCRYTRGHAQRQANSVTGAFALPKTAPPASILRRPSPRDKNEVSLTQERIMAVVRFDEADDLIDICLDNVFKAVFARGTPESRGALSALLSAVTGRNLTVIAITANAPNNACETLSM